MVTTGGGKRCVVSSLPLWRGKSGIGSLLRRLVQFRGT